MDEQDLDDWFNAEQDRLEKNALSALNQNQSGATETFDEEHRKLIAKYQKKKDTLQRKQQMRKRIEIPIEEFRQSVREKKRAFKKKCREKQDDIRKWLFNKRFKRLIRK